MQTLFSTMDRVRLLATARPVWSLGPVAAMFAAFAPSCFEIGGLNIVTKMISYGRPQQR
jgi:hypothetical protein